MKMGQCSETSPYKIHKPGITQKKAYSIFLLTDLNFGQNFVMLTYNDSMNVPKRRHIKFISRRITQKKAYSIFLLTDLNFGQNFVMLTHNDCVNVPKRRHIKFISRGITQKKSYSIFLLTDLNVGQNFVMLTHYDSVNFSIKETQDKIFIVWSIRHCVV